MCLFYRSFGFFCVFTAEVVCLIVFHCVRWLCCSFVCLLCVTCVCLFGCVFFCSLVCLFHCFLCVCWFVS